MIKKVRLSVAIAFGIAALMGCDSEAKKATEASATSGEGSPLPPGAPFGPRSANILAAVNAGKLPIYAGPFATLRGTVSITGDQPPTQDDVLKDIPADCTRARVVYEKLFREGAERSAPDVLVSVTGYDKFVPVAEDVVTVEGQGCAWGSRTVALMLGQRLDLKSTDNRNYLPTLTGNQDPVSFVAVAHGKPTSIYPKFPGRYLLQDGSRSFMNAEVFVVKYPTTTVTGIDGKYTLTRVPPGKLTVTAFLPQLLRKAEKQLDVQAGQTYEVNLAISFSLERDTARVKDVTTPTRAIVSEP